MLVDPGACRQHLRRVADHDIIAADWCALSDIDQSYLVALGHVLVKRGTRRQLRTRGEPEVVGDNGHVVVRVHRMTRGVSEFPKSLASIITQRASLDRIGTSPP